MSQKTTKKNPGNKGLRKKKTPKCRRLIFCSVNKKRTTEKLSKMHLGPICLIDRSIQRLYFGNVYTEVIKIKII